jgi:hypothetical protein
MCFCKAILPKCRLLRTNLDLKPTQQVMPPERGKSLIFTPRLGLLQATTLSLEAASVIHRIAAVYEASSAYEL